MTTLNFPTTLPEALKIAAGGNKAITFINSKTSEHTLSYRALYTSASRLLHQFQQAGIDQGAELILLTENNEQFLLAFWAALLGGIIPVPLSAANNLAAQKRVLAIFQKLQNPYLWTSTQNLSRLTAVAEHSVSRDLASAIQQQTLFLDQIKMEENAGKAALITPRDTAFIQFSSGSTGAPKGVVLTHRNLLSNIRSILAASATTAADISLSWMPLTHDMGIIGFHLSLLVSNNETFLMPPELFVRRPTLWLEKISEKRATLTSSPNFGYQHLLKYFAEEKHPHLDLACLRLIFNGAEPISAELCRRFNQTLKPCGLSAKAIFPVYGLAEASLAVTFSRPEQEVASVFIKRAPLHCGEKVAILDASANEAREMVLLGGPVAETEIRIADQQGKELPENHAGFVLIRGANVTGGYYNDPLQTARSISPDHWLNTGDLGFMQNGQLVICGRHKDLIIINGQNYYPQDLENLCASINGLETEKIAACSISDANGESAAIFVMFRGNLHDFSLLASEIRGILTQQAGIDTPYVIPVPSFPKTTSGKVQRFLLAEQFAAGDHQTVLQELEAITRAAQTTSASGSTGKSKIEQNLLDICNTVIPDKQIAIDDDLFEIGASSMNLVQIHERIDSLYPEQVEVTDLFDYPSISLLAAFLELKKTSAA